MQLSNGREVEINLYNVTRAEFKNFCSPKGNLETEDIFISKVTGLTVEEVSNLTMQDFKDLVSGVFNIRKKKTLASEPTSPS